MWIEKLYGTYPVEKLNIGFGKYILEVNREMTNAAVMGELHGEISTWNKYYNFNDN